MSFNHDSVFGADKLTVRYGGCWPTFHDAEIIGLMLVADRGNWMQDKLNPDFDAPELTLKIQSCEEAQGTIPTLVTLRFYNVEELTMSGFNYQNSIYGLVIEQTEASPDDPDIFHVRIDSAFGLGATFRCGGIEVVGATD